MSKRKCKKLIVKAVSTLLKDRVLLFLKCSCWAESLETTKLTGSTAELRTDKDHFVAYTSRRLNNETRRRTFYFSILEDKVKFLAEAKKCIERLQDTSERY